ncbi:hypothetical protein GCM10009700_31970 [Brevibacterium sanguinis]|uniref:hypothetical protein n=1 Tax=Brevibacterium sanguinis TaxID=232444 RepID=UPI0031D485F8
MSYLRITKIHPDGDEKLTVTELPAVSAAEAFANGVNSLRTTQQGYLADHTTRTIRLNPDDAVPYTRYYEYADNYEDFPV